MLSRNRVKYIQSLGQKKFRNEYGVFIAEGPKIINELLASCPEQIRELLATPEWLEQHAGLPESVVVEEVSNAELERISQLQTPNEVLAVVSKEENPVVKAKRNAITLVLDTIQDPGNLGTIIRIADWYGIEQLICSDDCADCYNSKVVQSTMGSIARVKIIYTGILQWLKENKEVPVYAAALNGEPLSSAAGLKEAILVIGNESKGIQAAILEKADHLITIPRIGHAESLNAAVAAGIILSHIT